ncbi:NFX1-type zinc finger-containing protein 1 [Colletotrichum spaethianum]|uniref:NFX1-type zinc finger-containing protein 1 n=1 Tax=Colletotrichum spaethianum TaxID=700344 RepID=A0AA37LD76_9PEZI|nr:NFX1-type zinc finger-containing protein 1 [Colletotrichum spaethianum]GKT46258.1 NFX1-type zinc finger-containing protein 1 [Colletotrichum spaethianum]
MILTTSETHRASRLLKVFWDVTKGGRAITTAADARLFLEAVRTNPSPAACLEIIMASDVAKDAVRHSIRIDLSTSFVQKHVIPFIAYLSDPGVKMVFNGELLHQLLLIIAQPPVLWDNLLQIYRESHLTEGELYVFAWLCFELASLPDSGLNGLVDDISAALEQPPFQKAQDHKTRDLTYRIRKVLDLRSSSSPEKDLEAAGGRHDNDFANFRDISVFPTSDEFYSSALPFYRRASEVASVEYAQRPRVHLDNQFRLLREDMLGELRDDLKVATGRKKSKKKAQILAGLRPMGISTGDEKRGHFCAVLVACCQGLESLKKPTPPKRKAWLNDNKWFLRHQSFGALCGDKHIVAFAFLLRDEDELVKAPPVVALQFTSSDATARALLALQAPANLKFILVDTPVFAYQPVLECLQDVVEMPLGGKLLRLGTDDEDDQSLSSLQQSAHIQLCAKKLQQAVESESRKLIIDGQPFDLDGSQIKSLLHALERPVALIQGPPGTGKSFVGALAAKILLTDPSKRILVLSYTNHALDQFLEDLMNIGISPGNMVRLGSKSTEATAMLSLDQQLKTSSHRRSRAPWGLIVSVKEELSTARHEINDACRSLVRGRISSMDILNSLEFSDDDQAFYEAFLLPEQDEGFRLAGRHNKAMAPDYLLGRWMEGQDAGELRRHISPTSERIWKLPKAQRSKHVQAWTECLQKERIEAVQSLVKRFDETQEKLDALFNESKRSFVQTKKLIGCTTTAAAKYKSLIKAAKPDVVLVEEAGEILEAHVLTALHSETSQLILIGDHKQLRPKINNYTLSVENGEGFDLNRSLFERLILQGHDHDTLQKQHRMHPEISDLVRQMTYPALLDDPKTEARNTPKGLQGRVSFINHSHPEDTANEIADRRDAGAPSSKRNEFEAQMVLKLVKYLGQQGYRTENLVVLTPYLGQLRLLKEMLSKESDPWLNDLDSFELIRAGLMTAAAAKAKPGSGRIRLSTIDNYQGEESDVVIASLTRSNNKGDIGFMKAPERLNVLVSRARECLVLIGNMDTFMKSSQGQAVWLPFFSLLKEKEYLHDGVPIRCQQHPEKTALLNKPEDFKVKCPDGGCDEVCMVPCEESIKKTCDRGHKFRVRCTEQDAACRACLKEDEDTKRRIQRDLQMEKERELAQNKYAQDLQQMQDELDHERRLLKYAQEQEDHKQTLKQTREELEAIRQTRARAETMKAAAKARPNGSGDHAQGDKQEPQETPVPDSSAVEWSSMKRDGASSSALDTLMGMIGLESVKEEFLSIKSKVDTAVRQGISLTTERFGCTLLGNPGTGKTTVARIYSKFLTSVGVIAGSGFKETTGSKLASMGVQACQQMLNDMLDDGGGVIFIDEAYQLSSGNSPGGRAVLDFLLAEVENLTGKIVFILAGYSKQMESFFAHNPGFPSRFPIEMKFNDYSDDELLRILQAQIKKRYGGRMKWDDHLYLRVVCRRLGRGRGKEGFGNARAVENLLAKISSRQANRIRKERLAGAEPDDLLFTKEDLAGPEPSSALGSCEAWIQLQSLIGLSSVKASVRALVDSIQTNYLRELAEEPVIEYTLNKVFLGSPGTGKTTVAKLYGQILVDLGLLSNGEVVVKNPSDFVGAVLGGSEAQTKGILESTVGKVLVIDEAYGLYGGGGSNGKTSDPFKTAVVDTIVAEVQSVPGEDRCVLLLGYKDQMEEMFQNVNPGLSRRFPLSSAFVFEDFNSSDLGTILDLKLKQQGFSATDQAKQVAMEMLERARNRPNFGNAGEVDILLNDAKARHQRRLSSKQTKKVSTLEALDFDEDFDRAERADTNVAKLFDGTVGCEKIIATLEGYQESVRSMKALGMDPKESIPFNFLFRGPPGTGKTSTAKKMGKVFYDMGFLAEDYVQECSATDLIGEYIGQTGPKVRQLLDKALGRVLFIDEAYRLAEGRFAKEAVDELVDAVTKDKYKGRLVIILAGYDDDINRLLSVNPGMSSRFPEVIDFHSLSPENCFDLVLQFFLKQNRKLESSKAPGRLVLDCLQHPAGDFKDDIVSTFRALSMQPNWASARDVETLAKSIFLKSLKFRQGTCITITEAMVETELYMMLEERDTRGKQADTIRGMDGLQDLRMAPAPPQTPHIIKTQHQTAIKKEEVSYTPPESPVEEIEDGKRKAVRDAGVSDEAWEQLEKDKKAQEENDAKYRAMLDAKRRSIGAAREAILKELMKEEERRKKEEEQRKKAAMMGRCPMGYDWIRQAVGFRCEGGSHFISDGQLASFFI